VEKFTTQLLYAQSIPISNPIPNPNPIPNRLTLPNPIASPIPNRALVELTSRLTEIDSVKQLGGELLHQSRRP